MKPVCLFVVGPTACGKSDLALEIAERRTNTEIINCDSIQFFEGLDIGSAKPSSAALARVPHHLVGHMALGTEYTAGDFRRDALKIIERGGHFIPTGGSGFYIQALEKGMYEAPAVLPEVRARLEVEWRENGAGPLFAELKSRDAEAAAKISVHDRYRILRSLELLRSSTETISERRKRFEKSRPEASFQSVKLGLTMSRDRLRARVQERTQQMLAAGLIDEVRALRLKGLSRWTPLSSVGYRETQMYLDGELHRTELAERISTATMQLAKRQMTWFKRDPEITWFDADDNRAGAFEFAREPRF